MFKLGNIGNDMISCVITEFITTVNSFVNKDNTANEVQVIAELFEILDVPTIH